MACILYDMIGWLEENVWKVLAALTIILFWLVPMVLYALA
jgi:hypothetical protein